MKSDETPDQVNYDQGPPRSAAQADSKLANLVRAGHAAHDAVGRGGRGRFRTKVEQIERDARAAQLYDQGLTFREVAERLGMSNAGRASDAVKRHISRIPTHDLEERRKQQEERIQGLRARTTAIADAKHLAHSNGRVIQHDDPVTGEPIDVYDSTPVLNAIKELRALLEREAKLYGLDAATKQEFSGDVSVGVELVGVDPTDV